ncbi:MAG TPA: NAD-dependent epimerase/dehydratase family protein [Bacteroidales bacterium]|jgi:nucleoside-diphosphate-sugar epimerase|nr:NAD-dependent epimerase/dehydratase family protein [Bacteroidales bacterium]HOR82192.1 NAD-dependent epimerase/dehydratase family protein [Bacteroidales bacterium]HPJ91358.1 NAD-dependent epimerase/dehydratase family protein [Bacteroidales bacterium]HPX58832.1 NAD-dependent epimerase/dehydratase family protein [Bacteroidales bacterium]
MNKILVLGCAGQIGSDLTLELRKIHGNSNVYASDIRQADKDIMESGPFEMLNVLEVNKVAEVVKKHGITQIYHLAAILSGNAEKKPLPSWDINMKGLLDILEMVKELKVKRLFWPSSIAVFGPSTPIKNTPQQCIMDPNTVYGISKLAGERWIAYYRKRYGVDTRSVRYPGLISYKTEAGGGTTDYAVEIYYEAIKKGTYQCFLEKDTYLPMMFMPDAIKATIQLMETDANKLSIDDSYNVGGMSFCPDDVFKAIKKEMPDFTITYQPDFRQAIANSWPQSIDDSIAQRDWGLNYQYDLDAMTKVMLKEIKKKF